MRRLGLGVIGAIVGLISLGMASALVFWWGSTEGLTSASAGIALLSVAGFVAAAWLVRSAFLKEEQPLASRHELLAGSRAHGILRVAKNHGGHLTLGEAALECRLSTSDARAILDAFYLDGVCEQHLNTSGQEVYIFSDFVDLEDAQNIAPDQPLGDEAEIALGFDALDPENSGTENMHTEDMHTENSFAEKSQLHHVRAPK